MAPVTMLTMFLVFVRCHMEGSLLTSTFIKILIAIFAFLVWIFTQKRIGNRLSSSTDGFSDLILNRTAPINQWLHNTPKASQFLLISSSLIIDALGLFLIYQGIWGESIRPLLGLVFVFSLRQVCQFMIHLPAPKGMIWNDPGVPSLFVTYKVSNDFFFSGHTALAVLGALELFIWGTNSTTHINSTVWIFIAGFICLYEIVVVLILRAHWSLDVISGALAALWIHEMSKMLAPTLDHLLSSLPAIF
jgi:hypothetical protein